MSKKYFKYLVINKRGRKISGINQAFNKEDLIINLKRKNLTPLSVKEMYLTNLMKKIPIIKNLPVEEPLKRRERLDFFRDMLSMVKIGITSTQAVKFISENNTLNHRIKSNAERIYNNLDSGTSFYDSLRQENFPHDLCSAIETGFSTSTPEDTLRIIIDKEIIDEKIRKTWLSVMTYPVVMGVIIFFATIAASIWLVPLQREVLMEILDEGAEVPVTSAFVFWMSDYLFYIIGGTILTYIIIKVIHINLKLLYKKYRIRFGNFYNSIPFIGNFSLFKEYIGICTTLTMGIKSNFNQDFIINKTFDQIKNLAVQDEFLKVKDKVIKNGMTIGQAMEEAGFQSVITNSFMRGELAGKDELLESLHEAKEYFRDKTFLQLEVLKQSSEFINSIAMYIIAIPIVLMALGPQFDMFVLMVEKM